MEYFNLIPPEQEKKLTFIRDDGDIIFFYSDGDNWYNERILQVASVPQSILDATVLRMYPDFASMSLFEQHAAIMRGVLSFGTEVKYYDEVVGEILNSTNKLKKETRIRIALSNNIFLKKVYKYLEGQPIIDENSWDIVFIILESNTRVSPVGSKPKIIIKNGFKLENQDIKNNWAVVDSFEELYEKAALINEKVKKQIICADY